jgi:hypothetical protein
LAILIVLTVAGSLLVALGLYASRRLATAPAQPTATPLPAGTFLDQTSLGDKTTAKFNPPGGWDLVWSYDCGGPGHFILQVYDADGQLSQANQGFYKNNVKDSGTQHYTGPGPLFLNIHSTCRWHVTAKKP